jgi:hypothetical protein
VSPQAAGFARAVVTQAAPGGQERAKNLLWAAGRLADWAIGLGLDPVPEVLLHPSVIERFTAHAPGLTGVTRRTLRTSLRFLARAVVPALAPADRPLPREHAKAPYAQAQTRSPPTTSRPPNSPATSSAGSPPTTPTATTASPAPPPRASSAARSARAP